MYAAAIGLLALQAIGADHDAGIDMADSRFRRRQPYLKFDRAFDEARIPDCLHQDALKF